MVGTYKYVSYHNNQDWKNTKNSKAKFILLDFAYCVGLNFQKSNDKSL